MDRRHFIRNSAVALGSLVSAEGAGAASPQGQGQGMTALQTGRIALAEKEYFEAPGFVLLVHHNNDSR